MDPTGHPVPTGPNPEAIAAAHALLDAARAGDIGHVLAWVDRGAPVDLRDPAGNSLLMLAAYHGHAALVTALADRGADVDLLNDRGQSPLAGAVFKMDRPTVEALLAAGADPTAGTPDARGTAAYFGLTEFTDLLGPA